MDLSIAAAFWFAGRGCGQLVSRDGNGGFIRFPGEPYTTPSRVLISGLGADELFGGYSHHRSAFLNAADDADALEQFANTLQRDLDRLPLRNLGRDDRLYSDHGKELRLPYLDEHVVNYATAVIPLSYKSVFRTAEGTVVPRGLGDKFFLRWCAWSMGLRGVSVERKRAVQFGARTAKMENKEERGDDAVDL